VARRIAYLTHEIGQLRHQPAALLLALDLEPDDVVFI
jgi:hypothetical protein